MKESESVQKVKPVVQGPVENSIGTVFALIVKLILLLTI
jgi:hypothetical protein